MISDGPSITLLADFVNGFAFKSEHFGDGGLPIIRIKQLLDSNADVDKTQLDVPEAKIDNGDVIFSWSASLAVRIWDRGPGLLNQHLFRVDPKPGVCSRWFAYALTVAVDRLETLMHGSAMTHITRDMLKLVKVTLPSEREQRAIADYLDAETARIDALIEKKRRMIELLQQRYWSWVSERIQHLNAPKVQLRRGLVWITDGPFGSSLTSSHYTDPGARVVRLSNIGMAEFKNKDEAYISADHYATLLKHRVRAGNLLIAGLGDANNHVGRGCVAPELGSAIVKADCYCAMVDQRTANPQFLALYLSSPLGRNAVAGLSRGSTRTRINLDVAKSVPIFLPSLSDQTSIVTEASRRRKAASSAQDSLGNQIELLTEHRQALITAAVAGEIGVPRSAAS